MKTAYWYIGHDRVCREVVITYESVMHFGDRYICIHGVSSIYYSAIVLFTDLLVKKPSGPA